MIRITIYQNAKSKCVGFRSEGHAEYEEAGQDIVCAAASMLIINTINAIETFTDGEFTLDSEESGFIDYHITGDPSVEVSLLLDSLVLGLTSMEDDDNYSDYMDIIFEEV